MSSYLIDGFGRQRSPERGVHGPDGGDDRGDGVAVVGAPAAVAVAAAAVHAGGGGRGHLGVVVVRVPEDLFSLRDGFPKCFNAKSCY